MSRTKVLEYLGQKCFRLQVSKTCLCGPCEEHGWQNIEDLSELIKSLGLGAAETNGFLSRLKTLQAYLRHDFRRECTNCHTLVAQDEPNRPRRVVHATHCIRFGLSGSGEFAAPCSHEHDMGSAECNECYHLLHDLRTVITKLKAAVNVDPSAAADGGGVAADAADDATAAAVLSELAATASPPGTATGRNEVADDTTATHDSTADLAAVIAAADADAIAAAMDELNSAATAATNSTIAAAAAELAAAAATAAPQAAADPQAAAPQATPQERPPSAENISAADHLAEFDERMEELAGCEKHLNLYLRHLQRKALSSTITTECLEWLKSNPRQCHMIIDYKQKVLPQRHRETQTAAFGKKGKSLHGACAIRWDSSKQDFEVINVRVACDDSNQTWYHSLNAMRVTLAEVCYPSTRSNPPQACSLL